MHGYISRRATVARKPFLSRLTQADYDAFASVDTSRAWTRFPAHVDVLTLHGLRDAVVPPYDAFVYARIYGARAPGTHVLRYVEEADHNFTGVRAWCLARDALADGDLDPYDEDQLHITFMIEEVSVSSISPPVQFNSSEVDLSYSTAVWYCRS